MPLHIISSVVTIKQRLMASTYPDLCTAGISARWTIKDLLILPQQYRSPAVLLFPPDSVVAASKPLV
jgi:hypothetical protein